VDARPWSILSSLGEWEPASMTAQYGQQTPLIGLWKTSADVG
jgi:hypothetical protein